MRDSLLHKIIYLKARPFWRHPAFDGSTVPEGGWFFQEDDLGEGEPP